MKKIGAAIVVVLIGCALYLLFWPGGMEAQGWNAPEAPALQGKYEPNHRLKPVQRIARNAGTGPESVAVDTRSRIYAGYADGKIWRFNANGQRGKVFADTGGRPLGMAFTPNGMLIVADAYEGLLAISAGGKISTLATGAGGTPFGFTDDVAVAPDGTIYFTDASSKYGQPHYLKAIFEHGGYGRLLRYEPYSGRVRVLLKHLQFANGVTVSGDGRFLLITETGSYRVLRYWLKGPKAGSSEVFIDNLPGFPDGISSNGKGKFWVALFAPRNAQLDWLSSHPLLRRAVFRLPEFLRPSARHVAFILGLNAQGQVVNNLQYASDDAYAPVTSVTQAGNKLYLGSLKENDIGLIATP